MKPQPAYQYWTETQTQALMAYRNAGMPATRIAMEMGLTKNQVLGRIHRVENPQPKKPRENVWTVRQKEIARRGALFGTDINEICDLLAKAGRSMEPKAVKDSRAYRDGLAQVRALEERMAHNAHDRQRLADNRAAREQTKERIQRAGTYRCPHHPNDRINLPVVKGYVGEQAHG